MEWLVAVEMEGGGIFCSSQWPTVSAYTRGLLSIDGTAMELAPLQFLLLPYEYLRLVLLQRQLCCKEVIPPGYQMISGHVTEMGGETIHAKGATASSLRIKHPFN
jgi:hypothetical protein